MRICLLLLFVAALTSCREPKANVASPFQKINGLEEMFTPLTLAEIRPQGWLRDQIRENLDGYTGRLDTLAPNLIIDDKIYGEKRLTADVKSKDVGALGPAGDWQVQFLWWNSETQSNWRDGYIRSAILLDDSEHLAKLKSYVDYILSTQDEDGYLGIYDKDLRYNFDNENGELWAKASLLRGLLAWYEHTGDKAVLNSVERAVRNVMENYPVGTSHPFHSRQPNVGGTSHGLTLTDVFESLYRITNKEEYRDYVIFLYEDFSMEVLNEDGQYLKLMNDTLPLKGHGVHTYEHLRSLAAAYYASGNPSLREAIDKFLVKIDRQTLASGAAVSDEWIGGRKADATNRGYEYCSLHELMHSYLSLLLKTGDEQFADKSEQIFFNAAQGARHPAKSCIAYLKSDNSYYMTGGLNGDASDPNQTRYSYSPVHQEAAVCCVPNAGRIAPYFIQHMWMKGENTIVAFLLGPSSIKTTLDGKPVVIKEQTNYPYENTIRFEVTADQAFTLRIRKPNWVKTFSVSENFVEGNGFIAIQKKWKGTQTVEVRFDAAVEVREDLNHEKYFTYGSLVLAAPIAADEVPGKSFPIPGFYNYKYAPKDLVVYSYAGDSVQANPDSLRFLTNLRNSSTGNLERVELIPMGSTILRQVTFK